MSEPWLASLDEYLTRTPAMPSVEDHEDIKERDWHDLHTHAREFVQTYGARMMLRCVSEALDDQRELFKR